LYPLRGCYFLSEPAAEFRVIGEFLADNLDGDRSATRAK
jgi:hypothetical protein